MAARRRRRAHRRSQATETPSPPSSGRRGRSLSPRADREGRYSVSCPRCHAGYRVPEDHLDARVTCKHCRAVFTPRTLLTKPKRTRKGGLLHPGMVAGILFTGFVVVFVLVIQAILAKPEEKKEVAPRLPQLTVRSPMYLAFEDFADAVRARNEVQVVSSVDLPSLYEKRKKSDEPQWGVLDREGRSAFKAEFIKALFEGRTQEGRVLRDWAPQDVRAMDIPENCEALQFLVYFEFVKAKTSRFVGKAEILADTFKAPTGVWKVRGFKVTREPYIRHDIAKRKKKTFHPKLGKGKVEVVIDKDTGEKVEIRRIKLQPLDHLADTPPDIRKEVDRKIEILMDPDLPPRKFRPAERRLIEIGAPAIPRLLTKMYETKGTTQEERNSLRLVVGILRTISGNSFGYEPGTPEDGTFGTTDAKRLRALEAWFGWYSEKGWKIKAFKTPLQEDEEDFGIEEFGEMKKRKKGSKKKN